MTCGFWIEEMIGVADADDAPACSHLAEQILAAFGDALDASGAVVLRRRAKRETLIALAAKLPPCVVRFAPDLRNIGGE
jgi:hypothetical protein